MSDEAGKIKSVALVSGKGGSGKTLVAATMAKFLGENSRYVVVLVDTDLGTGGVSYYLGFEVFRKTGRGFCDLVMRDIELTHNKGKTINEDELIPFSQSDEMPFSFVSIGNHRSILKAGVDQDDLTLSVGRVFVNLLRDISIHFEGSEVVVIADCRGGVDADSLEICKNVDEIILVAETDATSIQSSQHLTDVLGDKNLSHKLQGFVLNKVFDDPSQLAKAGASLFRCPYLGALPFDIDAVRKYVSGELPTTDGLFYRQISYVSAKLFPEAYIDLTYYSTKQLDFSKISLRDPDERIGAVFVIILLSYSLVLNLSASIVGLAVPYIVGEIITYGTIVISIIGLIPEGRRSFGRMIGFYKRFFERMFFRRKR